MTLPNAQLGTIADVQGGLQVTRKRAVNPVEVPYLRVANVYRDHLDLEKIKNMRVTETELQRVRLRQGDILVVEGHGNPHEIGRTAVWDGSIPTCVHQNHLIRVRVRNGSADPTYLSAFLNSPVGRRQLFRAGKTTSGLNTINVSNVRELEVPLPPLEEQRRIAAILDKANAIRRKRQQAIQLADELLRSVFLDMFGDPLTNPRGWPVTTLGALTHEMRYGTSSKCSVEPVRSGLPILRIPNILGGEVLWDDLKYCALDSKEESKLKLVDGDLLFVRSNGNPAYIARCAVFGGDRNAAFASYLIRVRLNQHAPVLARFVRRLFSLPSYRAVVVREARTTAGNYNISTKGLGRLRVYTPPVADQQSFAAVEERLGSVRAHLVDALAQTDQLFDALVQRAFRGEL